MKFTQTDAAKKIRSTLTKGGKTCFLSDRTISEQLETLMKMLVNDETELDDFVSQVEPFFKTANGGAQNDQSEFVKKWNEDHPEPSTTHKTDPEGTTSTASAQNPDLAALMAKVKELEEKQAAADKAKSLSEKKNELIAKLKDKGVKDEEWITSFLGEVSISEDVDVDAKVESYLKLYNKGKASQGGGATPLNPQSQGESLDVLKQASEMAKQRNEQNANNHF
jgi:hypothetical protein